MSLFKRYRKIKLSRLDHKVNVCIFIGLWFIGLFLIFMLLLAVKCSALVWYDLPTSQTNLPHKIGETVAINDPNDSLAGKTITGIVVAHVALLNYTTLHDPANALVYLTSTLPAMRVKISSNYFLPQNVYDYGYVSTDNNVTWQLATCNGSCDAYAIPKYSLTTQLWTTGDLYTATSQGSGNVFSEYSVASSYANNTLVFHRNFWFNTGDLYVYDYLWRLSKTISFPPGVQTTNPLYRVRSEQDCWLAVDSSTSAHIQCLANTSYVNVVMASPGGNVYVLSDCITDVTPSCVAYQSTAFAFSVGDYSSLCSQFESDYALSVRSGSSVLFTCGVIPITDYVQYPPSSYDSGTSGLVWDCPDFVADPVHCIGNLFIPTAKQLDDYKTALQNMITGFNDQNQIPLFTYVSNTFNHITAEKPPTVNITLAGSQRVFFDFQTVKTYVTTPVFGTIYTLQDFICLGVCIGLIRMVFFRDSD